MTEADFKQLAATLKAWKPALTGNAGTVNSIASLHVR